MSNSVQIVKEFLETEKLMAVNKTNARTISKVVGSKLMELWPGTKIVLHMRVVNAFGADHETVRVKQVKVK